jgi:phospholipid-binding lipoprotein MlaA
MRLKNYLFVLLLSFNLIGFSSLGAVETSDDMLDEFEEEMVIEEKYDPLSGYNRVMTSFNDTLWVHFFTPVTNGYNAVVNEDIRTSIDNVFNNLYFPVRLVNNIFQVKFVNASEETGRFLINSTVGVLGLFDPAKSKFDLQEHKEDFGQTLGFYGVGSGPHIVLPLFGPSNLRDTIGIIPDSYLSIIDYKKRGWFTLTDAWDEFLAIKLYEKTNNFSLDNDKYERIKENAVDLYPYLRDMYEQYRDNQIKE